MKNLKVYLNHLRLQCIATHNHNYQGLIYFNIIYINIVQNKRNFKSFRNILNKNIKQMLLYIIFNNLKFKIYFFY